MTNNEALGRSGLSDHGEVETPFAENRLRVVALVRLEHHQHALLALGEQHLIGGHARLRDTARDRGPV